ncbi:hypothetical protein L202_02695 [Cryptococcus amylolentus CBS 6039]|uniref:Uncharacterized protein n=1 Tax=Cryptococcus amylolentus CBS 6039 TaxID=1295533 RepID=A0A1E3HWA8_9TREE|nr:hypothetical protein L202_02695 [Cryptococcus amylolentus CBS 6039]ODN80455.1 hypothetical protein L202_02695 [Cryptococcus amylolentus CBS 6039]
MSTFITGRPVSKPEWEHFHRLEGVTTSIVIELATEGKGELKLFVMKNKSHYNAFCKACVKAKKEILQGIIKSGQWKPSEELNAEVAKMGSVNTDVQRMAIHYKALSLVEPVGGVGERMLNHCKS